MSSAEEKKTSPAEERALLRLRGVTKTFHQGGNSLTVLNDVNMSIEPGEIVALVGPSGAGKSTLLQLAGLLDTPTSGQIMVDGKDVAKLSDIERTLIRRDMVGFVYQFHYLQPEFSALENIVIPQMIAGVSRKEAGERGMELLAGMKLEERADHRPARLSGGEQQRVAMARALANRPRLLLADEPTGNLDPQTSAKVFEQLLELVRDHGIGALIATHNLDLAEQMDRVLELKQGRIMAY